jgi:hypothetical protein
MKQHIVSSALVALFVAILTVGGYHLMTKSNSGGQVRVEHVSGMPSQSALYTLDENGTAVPLDFTLTAEKVMNAVVHIRSTKAGSRADESGSFGARKTSLSTFSARAAGRKIRAAGAPTSASAKAPASSSAPTGTS